jgi:putative ABC transport system permease protein
MQSLMQDLRFAVRMLAKSPGFTLIAVLCTALGIGANTAIFSVVNAILLRPFPYADPDGIVSLYMVHEKEKDDEEGYSYLDLQDLRRQTRTLSQIGAYTTRSLTISGSDEPERVSGVAISADLFPMLGLKPMLGRNFRPEEDRPGAPPVILLSHDLWQQRFDGDPNILGRTIVVNATGHVVVGVMEPGFEFPERQAAWVTMASLMQEDLRTDRYIQVLARLQPEATFDQAATETALIAERLVAEYPDTNRGWAAGVKTLREEFAGDELRLVVLTMMGAVLCVLLIACANVANLLLARATSRQREVAVRVSLGATRFRILRQLLTESVLIGVLGGLLGILFGYWGIRWIEASIPSDNQAPYWVVFSLDPAVLLFTLGIAVVTGLLFGLAPALQASKTDLNETLKDGARGAGGGARNRVRSALVVAEVALSLILLVGASLFVRSFLKLQTAEPGFSTANLLTLRVFLPGDSYEDDAVKAQRAADLLRRIEGMPGVEAATVSNFIPLAGGGGFGAILIDGQSFAPGDEPNVFYTGSTGGLFPTLGLEPVAGRLLTARESLERSGYAVVNRSFAQRFWPQAGMDQVLGKRFRLKEEPPNTPEQGRWLTVVGVVPDIQNYGVDEKEIPPSAFLPYPYQPARSNGITIRTAQDPGQIAALVREQVRAADPLLPVYDVRTMEEVRQRDFWEFRFFGGMFSVFGAIALFLAAIGVYGVLSYSVSQRWREIGIRVALGAHRGDILRLVVGQGLALALGGIGIGLVGAFGVTRVISSILFDVSPTDPVSFASVSLLLAAVAVYASYLPASRAVAADPLSALRAD